MEYESHSLPAQQQQQLQLLWKDYETLLLAAEVLLLSQERESKPCPQFTFKTLESTTYVLSHIPIAGSPTFLSFPSLLVLHAEILSFGSKMLCMQTLYSHMPSTVCHALWENLARLRILLSQTKSSESLPGTMESAPQKTSGPTYPKT